MTTEYIAPPVDECAELLGENVQAIRILGQLRIITSYYADTGRHAGQIRIRLEGYLDPGEVTALQDIMNEARHECR